MSNKFYVSLSRTSETRNGSTQRYQDLIVWDVTDRPTGRLLKETHIPSREVRKFCKANNVVFDSTDYGFWGSTIYARDIFGQMHFKLKFDVEIPLEDEWKEMVAARDGYVAAERAKRDEERARRDAERQAKVIREVRISADQRSITLTLENGTELHSSLAYDANSMLLSGNSFFALLKSDPVIAEVTQTHGMAQRTA
jgi:hypothetical protein